MNRLLYFFIIVMSVFFIGCSSSDPQSQLKEIDELKGKGFPITSEQMEDINKHIAEGDKLMKEGKEKEASAALAKALEILNLANDAYIFNKAD